MINDFYNSLLLRYTRIILLFCLTGTMLLTGSLVAEEITVTRKVSGGMLCRLDGTRNVLLLEGTPTEIGKAHGLLMKKELPQMYQRVLFVAAGYAFSQGEWFFDRIDEASRRTRPFTPDRFYEEMEAMAQGAALSTAEIRQINVFPELFHCSGLAVAGKATCDGRVRHVRVLDYMRDIGLQRFATLIVYRPQGFNAWASVSYPGFIGTVTAMNEKGLAMGEMGGQGEGKWDGIPMSFLMRRVMEECATVEEAIALMKSVPLTCDYYYILSDRHRNMAAIEAIAETPEPVVVMRPGESDTRLPGPLEDAVYISGPGVRAETLHARLKEHYGKIDTPLLMEIIKKPVAMNSNLHDAIFEPETLDIWFAEAGPKSQACDEKYYHVNLKSLLEFFDREKQKSTTDDDDFF